MFIESLLAASAVSSPSIFSGHCTFTASGTYNATDNILYLCSNNVNHPIYQLSSGGISVSNVCQSGDSVVLAYCNRNIHCKISMTAESWYGQFATISALRFDGNGWLINNMAWLNNGPTCNWNLINITSPPDWCYEQQ